MKKSELRKLIREIISEDKWIQKAINPEHKGYCTPMTKKTCTPRRKALAKRFKKGIESEDAPFGKPDPSKYLSVNDSVEEDLISRKKELSPYQKFFMKILNKFGIDSPDQLTPKNKEKFFNYIDKNWKADKETDLDEMSSVNSMGGSDSYQTPFAFSKPSADPKKKRALKNNSWSIVERRIKQNNIKKVLKEGQYRGRFDVERGSGNSSKDLVRYAKMIPGVKVSIYPSDYSHHTTVDVIAPSKSAASKVIKMWKNYAIYWPELSDFNKVVS